MQNPILLYDGVCALCNRTVQFVLKRDPAGRFRFASLQGTFAAGILARHGMQADTLDTVYLVLNHESAGESILGRSDAIVAVLKQLGRFWRVLAFAFGVVPRPLRDWMYRLVAANRYRIFGRYDACPVPRPETRDRFLDT